MTMTTKAMDCMKPKPLGVRNWVEWAYRPPAMPAKKAPTDKARHFVFCGIDPHGLRSDLVIAHGNKTAAISGIDERGNHINRYGRKAERPKKIGLTVCDAQSARAAHGIHVLEDDPDDFAKTKRDDGEIIAAQSQGGNADEQSGHGRRQAASHQGEGENTVCGKTIRDRQNGS